MNVWDEARLGGRTATRHALGFWDVRHPLAGLAWLPPVSQRRQIYGKKRYVYTITFPSLSLTGPSTLNQRITITSDFWWTDSMFSSPNAGQQSFQLYDTANGVRYENIPLFDNNLGGNNQTLFNVVQLPITAPLLFATRLPYFERRITKIPAGAVLLGRLQVAFAGFATDGPQVALGGYID